MVESGISTAVYEGSLKDLREIEAFCAQHEFKKSAFFAAALSIALHRYLEKDILDIAINSAPEQGSPTAGTDVWRVTLSPEMAIQDLFEDRKSMALAQEYAETEGESKSGRWPTRKDKIEAGTSELPMSGLDAFLEQYGFLLSVTNDDAVTRLKLHLRTTPLLEHHGRLIAPTFVQAAQQILAHPGWKIKDLDLFSPDEIDTVSQWNQKHVFQPESRTMAEIVHQQSLQRPDSLAIRAWDGELTYGQLDDITDRFSSQLRCEGVGTDVLVPVCFEKSLWAIVAELGILKAGGAFVPTNPSQPPDQLKYIIEQTKAPLIVASAAQSGRLYGYAPKIITLSPGILSSGRLIGDGVPPVSIDAHSAAYVLFTSGSTGKSKGCVVNQSALADIARHCEALYLSPKSRVLQFASYTFGVSLIEIFCSLTAGATICIPSEEERLNNLAGYMTNMEINWAFLTPSTVNSIDDSTLVPQLEILILAGEPMSQHHVETWAHRLELYQAYGLTEWAGICGVSRRIKGPGSLLENVGLLSPTANAYLVEPADHNKLAPIGAVAELLLEGPSLARGYLNDPTKTASTFIDPPAWLSNLRLRGDGRVYKTGDLVQYQADGSFRYLSRKDTQVKIRGKRLELGEVEYCVCQHCPLVTRAIAEAVVPNGSDGTPILLVFLFYQTPAKLENDDGSDDDNGEGSLVGVSSSSAQQFRLDVEHLKAAMPQFLPEHMVPAIYLPLQYIPLTLTGKIDRRKLRERMCRIDREALESYSFEEGQCDHVPPATKTEITLHKLFAQILNVQPHKFGIHDSFLRLGGDSVKAMRLARVCQAHSLSLTVKDVLEIQTIIKLASFSESKQQQQQQPHQPENRLPLRVADNDEISERSAADGSSGDDETSQTSVSDSSKDSSESSTSDSEKIGPVSSSTRAGLFPLLALGSEGLDQLVTKRLPELGISADKDVEDAFPCAPIQEGILLSQARQPENYEMRFVWEITPAKYRQPIDIGQLQRAWRQLIKVHPMLRTIFIEGVTFDAFAIQVILTEGVPETTVVQCEAAVPNEVPCPDRLLGQRGRQSLPQLTIYQSNTGQVFAMLDINHAVTDATSMSILMRDLARFYDAKEEEYPSKRLHYSKYISYLQNSSSKLSALIFWKSYLAEISPCIFPQLNLQQHSEGGRLWQSVSIDLGHVLRYNKFRGSTGITLANLFKLAWSLVLRSFTASSKICFGYMTSGRDVPLLGIEDAVGPFINMLVCCLDIVSERSVLETLQGLQSDFIDALPHQRVSLAEIRHSLNLAANDALFNTTLTFPPQVEEEEMASIKFKETYLQDPGEVSTYFSRSGHKGPAAR